MQQEDHSVPRSPRRPHSGYRPVSSIAPKAAVHSDPFLCRRLRAFRQAMRAPAACRMAGVRQISRPLAPARSRVQASNADLSQPTRTCDQASDPAFRDARMLHSDKSPNLSHPHNASTRTDDPGLGIGRHTWFDQIIRCSAAAQSIGVTRGRRCWGVMLLSPCAGAGCARAA